MPTHCAAIAIRLAFSTSIVILNPSPSPPIRFSSGTGQSSKTTSAADDALIPILPCSGLIVMPGESRSTMNVLTPLDPRLRSWVAITTIVLDSSALVMNVLVPFRR